METGCRCDGGVSDRANCCTHNLSAFLLLSLPHISEVQIVFAGKIPADVQVISVPRNLLVSGLHLGGWV